MKTLTEHTRLTLKDAVRFLDRQAFYKMRETRQGVNRVVYFPVMIVDARALFGRLEFGYVPIGGHVEDPDSVKKCGWATAVNIELPE